MRILAAAALALFSASAVAPRRAAAPATREQTADQQIRHALNRLTFGPRPGDYEAVRAIGLDAWIDRQLHPERIDDRAADDFIRSHFPATQFSPAQAIAAFPIVTQAALAARSDTAAVPAVRRRGRELVGQLAAERVTRAEITERQLNEVMTDFWLNHFNVFAGKGPLERYFLGDYENTVIRPRALGRFRDLLGAVAKSPAMLFYLDNWESVRDSTRPALDDGTGAARRRAALDRILVGRDSMRRAIARRRPTGLNENYGRELLELHTLGVEGGYTQADVINAARALTGWSIDRPRVDARFVFRPAMHDAGGKTVLGHALAAGRGIGDGEELLDILARDPHTARFIATQLVRRFVSDSAPVALVDRAAATFRRTDGDIREVVRTIVTSDEFFSRAAYRAKVKAPFELVVSALRAVGAEPDTTPRTAQVVARLGAPIYGHQAPNGYPETGDAWINTGAILNRINFGLALAGGRLPGARTGAWPGAVMLAAAPHDSQVDGVIHAFLGGEASPDTRRILLAGINPLAGTSDSMPAVQPRGALARLVGLALGAPEFQRR